MWNQVNPDNHDNEDYKFPSLEGGLKCLNVDNNVKLNNIQSILINILR